MSEFHPVQPYGEAYFTFRDEQRAACVRHSPRQNRLLSALPAQDYERLLPDLEPISLPLGSIVYGAGDAEKYLYFLSTGIVSCFRIIESGVATEFALTGREGVIGVATFLGGESIPSQATVVSAGYAYRLPADIVRREFEHNLPLAHLLLRYTLVLIAEIAQTAVCIRHHSLQHQLCRWILSCLDRSSAIEVTMTQDLIANMMGVRRESVTEAASKLQKAGLIHYSRGHIAVPDRPRLEAHACECYAVVKREYDHLLPVHRQAEVVF